MFFLKKVNFNFNLASVRFWYLYRMYCNKSSALKIYRVADIIMQISTSQNVNWMKKKKCKKESQCFVFYKMAYYFNEIFWFERGRGDLNLLFEHKEEMFKEAQFFPFLFCVCGFFVPFSLSAFTIVRFVELNWILFTRNVEHRLRFTRFIINILLLGSLFVIFSITLLE